MNCQECRDNLAALLEGLAEAEQEGRMQEHLRVCAACRAELAELKELRGRLLDDAGALSRAEMQQEVMDRIMRDQAVKLRRIKMKIAGIGAAAAAAAAAALVIVFWTGLPEQEATAAEVLAKGAAAAANLRSVHIKCRMRTLPRDIFDLIDLDHDFVDVALWKSFADPVQWRMEKPGRVVVMDGQSAVQLVRSKPNYAYKAGPNAGFSEWLKALLDVDRILDRELRSALAGSTSLKLTHEKDDRGRASLLVTVEAKAQGDLTNDWVKNKFIQTSDNRRVYRLDAETKRLQGLKVYVHTDKGDVLAFEIVRIEYDQRLDPSVFKLEVPADAVWHVEPEPLPDNEKYEKMTPEEAARAFLEACGKEDWAEARKFAPGIRQGCYLGGVKVVRIGEAFQSGPYSGWFVPYEVRLKSGHVKKWNLAFKKDKRARRLIVDGGY